MCAAVTKRDYYEILGISRTASEDEIKKELLARYQCEADQVEKDYYDFIKMLETLQLTESNGEKKN